MVQMNKDDNNLLISDSDSNNIKNEIKNNVLAKRNFFNTHATININYRIKYLKKLKETIKLKENKIIKALNDDLGKSDFEAFLCEIGLVYEEINYTLKHIKKFSRIKKVKTPITMFSAKSYIVACPYGVVLIMSPWNYPFLLTMGPLIDAIATGNVCLLKPSNYSKATSQIIKEVIEEVFPYEYVSVILGGREENQELLEQQFDYIFFTGGKSVGHIVLEKAAKYLTPATLELGGKSPCIVTKSADLSLAAKRIVFGKYLNLGQTCVAPDYLLIDKSIKDEFVLLLIEETKKQFGPDPLKNPDYGKIINGRHLERLKSLIQKSNLTNEEIVLGGNYDDIKLEPTIMVNVTDKSMVMQEEIFGPILPIITYDDFSLVEGIISKHPTPLALYLFTTNKQEIDFITKNISYGGGCINDVIVHLATSYMAFGGVGNSGMGSYHGIKGFETFTHYKSVMDRKNWIDINIRYQPYSEKKRNLLKKMMK